MASLRTCVEIYPNNVVAVLLVKKSVRAKKWLADYLEEGVRKHPAKPLIIFEDFKYSYHHVNAQSNKVANFALAQGLQSGDIVALMITNEPAFIWTYIGSYCTKLFAQLHT